MEVWRSMKCSICSSTSPGGHPAITFPVIESGFAIGKNSSGTGVPREPEEGEAF